MPANTNSYGTYRHGGIPVKPQSNRVAGSTWFVDGVNGIDSNSGKKPGVPFETIAAAVSAASSYDTIYVRPAGNAVYNTNDYSEAVTIPYTKPGIRLIGCGNGRMEGVLWTVGTANDTILTIKSRDCYVEGFRFRPNGATSWAVKLHKWVGAATSAANTDASGATFFDCAFRSTTTDGGAIWMANGGYAEGANDITVEECTFDNCLYAIYCNAPATVPSRTIFKNVRIANCTKGIAHSCRRSKFERVFISDMAGGMMMDLDVNGGAAAATNIVHECTFGDVGSEIEEINAGSTDSWFTSYFGSPIDAAELAANGLILTNPNGLSGTKS